MSNQTPSPAWPDWAVMNEDGTLTLHVAAMLEDEQLIAANHVTWGAVIRMMALRTLAPNLPRRLLLAWAMEGLAVDDGAWETVVALYPNETLTRPWASEAQGEHQ